MGFDLFEEAAHAKFESITFPRRSGLQFCLIGFLLTIFSVKTRVSLQTQLVTSPVSRHFRLVCLDLSTVGLQSFDQMKLLITIRSEVERVQFEAAAAAAAAHVRSL